MPSIMPLSALASALRGAGRQHLTASTIAAARKEVTGSHVFRIQGYTQAMRKTVPTGTAITSTDFRVGGNRWQIECYPNGKDEEHRGYTSLFLKAAFVANSPARFRLTLLGAAGKPTSCARATEGHVHFSHDEEAGWKDFVRNDELHQGEQLADDCLTVLCDVAVDQGIRADEVATDKVLNWSKEPTDVKLHVGGKTFPAHRWVLESGSLVFTAALQNTSDLHIAGVDAEVFDALLQSMYADGALPTGHGAPPQGREDGGGAAGGGGQVWAAGSEAEAGVRAGAVCAPRQHGLRRGHACAGGATPVRRPEGGVHGVLIAFRQSEIVHDDGWVRTTKGRLWENCRGDRRQAAAIIRWME